MVETQHTSSMRFIGLDLAWSARNPTGAAVVEGDARGGALRTTQLLGGDDEVIAFVREQAAAAPTLVMIDAPLHVPNQSGRRPAEAEISRAFARYHAGAHPANRNRLAVAGVVRGETLVVRLEALGFTHQAEVVVQQPVRQIVEVYTHPALIAFFDLERIIQYKARPTRSHAHRLAEFTRYQDYLRALSTADPALRDTTALLAHDLNFPSKARLKDYEDLLDGVLCAYIGQYLWRWGMSRARVFGNMAEGYITTPVPPHMWPDH